MHMITRNITLHDFNIIRPANLSVNSHTLCEMSPPKICLQYFVIQTM
jgi:hypothetical protein